LSELFQRQRTLGVLNRDQAVSLRRCDDGTHAVLFPMRRFSLRRASRQDAQWFQAEINRESPTAQLSLGDDLSLSLERVV